MFWLFFIIVMGVLGRLSGNGFGQKFGMKWLPEALFSLPFGMALSYAVSTDIVSVSAFMVFLIGSIISYLGMQSATWYFLRWEKHDDPNTERGGTIKPIIDYVAGKFGYKLGDEGYAWIAASIKGFIIGLPVGGFLTAILWSLGYEIGSHAKGRVERFGIKDSHVISEFMSAAGGGFSIYVFVQIINIIK